MKGKIMEISLGKKEVSVIEKGEFITLAVEFALKSLKSKVPPKH